MAYGTWLWISSHEEVACISHPLMLRWVCDLFWPHSGSDAIFCCVLPFIPWEQNHCHVNKQKLVCRVMRDKLPGSPHWPGWLLSNQQASEWSQSIPSWPVTKCWHMTAAAATAKSLQSCPTLCDPHRRQPTRLLCFWDSPGKNTGVGCHFLLQCMHAC